ncbi:hypothetical protein HGM15179_011692 [Zosterops borbonicus]|uniref:Uncharacterized protein n=1 Tax=Zosterops borbonicus TaxID=364589 RepID=A0A8K1GCT6_9PASS|nr:hypothetical protein HGM15179_011692 [Zosterops borbonicus]
MSEWRVLPVARDVDAAFKAKMIEDLGLDTPLKFYSCTSLVLASEPKQRQSVVPYSQALFGLDTLVLSCFEAEEQKEEAELGSSLGALPWLSAQCQQNTLQDPQQRRHPSSIHVMLRSIAPENQTPVLVSSDQPEGSCRGLPGAKETTPELTSCIHQLQQETEAWQPKGQRQALVQEPQHGEPRACQDTQQEDLDPAQVLATIQELQLELDFCRGTNHKQLVQLQEQECAVEQEHQDLVILMQQFQALMGKVSDTPLHLKDQAVQTEVTSYFTSHSDVDTSHDIPKESRELLKQLGAQKLSQGLQHSPAQLQEQLGATQAQEQQSVQQLSQAKEAIQGLHRKVEELQQQLCWQVRDVEDLQEELAKTLQESTNQVDKIAAYKTHKQRLLRKIRKMQSFKEQSKQEICSLQERLQELSSLVQHWQQLHLDSEQTLALREEELVVCKVELAFLKEELSKMTEQVQEDTNRHSRHTTQDAGREPIPNIQKTSAAPQVLQGNNLTAPALHDSPSNTHLQDKKQCKTKQRLD